MVMRLPAPPFGESIGHRENVRERDDIRVALVEDKRLTREGLGALLDSDQGLRCVGLYASVEQALSGLESDPCDVLLLDIQLPGISGVEGVAVLRERFPDTQILMLTIYEDEDKVFDSIRNGANGYLLKKTPPAQIIEAVRQARRGESPLSPEVARQIVQRFRKTGAATRKKSPLTTQELGLVRLLADGHSYQSAAQSLGISINTVRDHVRSVYEKLHVHTKSQAVSRALRGRLIE
jgi:DNA-binding NarL/FixJ family response regulator